MPDTLHTFNTATPAAVDALLRANRVAAQGFEQLAKHCVETARQSFEEGVQIQRRLSDAGNFTDLAAVQNQVASDAWQSVWARGREWSELNNAIARAMLSAFNGAATEAEPVAKPQKRAA